MRESGQAKPHLGAGDARSVVPSGHERANPSCPRPAQSDVTRSPAANSPGWSNIRLIPSATRLPFVAVAATNVVPAGDPACRVVDLSRAATSYHGKSTNFVAYLPISATKIRDA